MCRAATCKVCGKTTWAGCGNHIDDVKRGVPAGQWCPGHEKGSKATAAAGSKSGSEPQRGFFARLFGG
ncbi:hypothetical protein GCM10022261_02360 [Brevibacterium daeguense]|uniref:Uncharacterized protein n=1 Tax=Brevibacterium daeguense TaxID=909936 RepID=A0ABP8EFS4_9MICO|nr:hypothetical protein [Brevibacterium daeguense]